MVIIKNRNTLILFLMSLLFFVCVTAFDPFISVYAETRGFSMSMIGTVIGITGITSMLTRFPIGILSDSIHNRRVVIQMGLIITMLAWGSAFFFPGLPTLLFGKVADGLTGATWVVYSALFLSYAGKENTVKAMGILSLTSSLGSFIGSTIGGIVSKHFGYSATFLVAVAAAFVTFLLSFCLTDYKLQTQKREVVKEVKGQITDKKIWLISILGIVALLVPYATKDAFTPIVAKELGADAFGISVLFNIHLIANSLTAVFLVSSLVKRVNILKLCCLGAVGQGIVAVLIPFAPSLIWLYVLQALAGVFLGLNFTILTTFVVLNVPEEKQATRLGLFQSIYSIGIFFGPMSMGIVMDMYNKAVSFALVGILSILGGILIVIKRKQFEEKKI